MWRGPCGMWCGMRSVRNVMWWVLWCGDVYLECDVIWGICGMCCGGVYVACDVVWGICGMWCSEVCVECDTVQCVECDVVRSVWNMVRSVWNVIQCSVWNVMWWGLCGIWWGLCGMWYSAVCVECDVVRSVWNVLRCSLCGMRCSGMWRCGADLHRAQRTPARTRGGWHWRTWRRKMKAGTPVSWRTVWALSTIRPTFMSSVSPTVCVCVSMCVCMCVCVCVLEEEERAVDSPGWLCDSTPSFAWET